MTSICSMFRRALCATVWTASVVLASPASAQEPVSSPAPAVTVEAGVDVANQYLFRGVRQNLTGLVVSPHGEVTVRALGDAGVLERLAVGFGFWNSLNTGDTGSDGPAGQAWYESRIGAVLDFQFDRGLSVRTAYTTYISPNDLFSTAKEIAVTVALDDSRWLGRAAVRPYVLVAQDIDTAAGRGQLDGGLRAGRYLEIGATPGFSVTRASFTVPIKIGLSLGDYYELGDADRRFGFASAGGYVSVPLGRPSRLGRWRVRGGVEVFSLGETTRVFNGGERVQTRGSVGIALMH